MQRADVQSAGYSNHMPGYTPDAFALTLRHIAVGQTDVVRCLLRGVWVSTRSRHPLPRGPIRKCTPGFSSNPGA